MVNIFSVTKQLLQMKIDLSGHLKQSKVIIFTAKGSDAVAGVEDDIGDIHPHLQNESCQLI